MRQNLVFLSSLSSLMENKTKKEQNIILKGLTTITVKEQNSEMPGTFAELKPEDCTLKQDLFVDYYMEKLLFCEGRPIRSLETAQDQLDAQPKRNYEKDANELYDRFKRIKNGEPLVVDKGLEPSLFEQFQSLVEREHHRTLKNMLEDLYNSSPPADELATNDIYNTIVNFLENNQCSISTQTATLIHQLSDETIERVDLGVSVMNKGERIGEKTKSEYIQLVRNMDQIERDVFSICFPKYKYSKQDMETKEQQAFDAINRSLNFGVSRDKKLAHSMVPFLNQGGAFALVGFSHLTGVIKELRALDYVV